jgi:hypothetical protein
VSRSELNLSYLRTLASERNPPPSPAAIVRFTRRGFLQLAAATAATGPLSPLERAYKLSDRIELVHVPGRVAIRFEGVDRFVIDRETFAGSPHLSVNDTSRSYVVSLNNARFPGLTVAADLKLEMWEGVFGWAYRIHFGKIGCLFRGILSDWLAGKVSAQARFNSAFAVASRKDWALDIGGQGDVAFRPDWTLEFKGPGIVTASIEGTQVKSDSFCLSLPMARDKSLLRRAPRRRSVAVLKRGSYTWRLFPHFASTAALRLEATGALFDKLTVETGELRSGIQTSAFIAESSASDIAVHARPFPSFVGADGVPFMLPLAEVRYAGILESVARYCSARLGDRSWLHLGSLSFGLQDNPSHPVFEAQKGPAETTPHISVLPCSAISINSPAGIVVTGKVPSSAAVPLTFGRFLCKAGYFLHLNCEHQKAYSSANGLRLRILRPKDLLQITLEFYGMQFEHSWGTSYLRPGAAKEDARVIVHFPPQAIAEESPYLGDPSCSKSSNSSLPDPPVKTRLGQCSRLVFQPFVKSGAPDRVKFEINDLLNWTDWQLVVGKFARPPLDSNGKVDLSKAQTSLAKPEPPTPTETSIELPYRVIISPDDRAQFHPKQQPFQGGSSKRFELWHAPLEPLTESSGSTHSRDVRIIWTREDGVDFCPPQSVAGKNVCAVPIDANDRRDLLTAFTTYVGKTYQKNSYVPPAMPVRALALSALGGWLDGAVQWEPAEGQTLESWKQSTASARDNLVQLGRSGFLVPTGHAVALIVTTQREWATYKNQQLGYLVKRCYIHIKQREKQYPAVGQLNNARDLPFTKIVITRENSPYLDPSNCVPPFAYMWPMVCGQLFRFPLELTDHEGRVTTCTLPMQFVSIDVAFASDSAGQQNLAAAQADYVNRFPEPDVCSNTTPSARGSLFESQKIAFTPSAKVGDSSFSTHRVIWNISKPDVSTDAQRRQFLQPPWYPALQESCVALDAAQNFAQGTYNAKVKYADPYIVSGFPSQSSTANLGEVFFVAPDAPHFSFPGEKTAGVALPSARVGAISRRFGIVGGDPLDAVKNASAANFDPKSFFKNANATLLGAIDLAELVAPIASMVDQESRVPKLIQQEIRDVRAQYDQFRGQVEQIPKGLDVAVQAFRQYVDLANKAADALKGAGTAAVISKLTAACTYDVIPPELQVPAEQAAIRAQQIRANFEDELSKLPQDTNISLVREYIVFKVTQNQGLNLADRDLQSLRDGFRIATAQKIALVDAGIEDAVSQLGKPVGATLIDVQTRLQQALDHANPAEIIPVLSELSGVIEDFGAATSAVDRVCREVMTLSQNIHSRIDEVKTGLQGDVNRIKTEIQDQRWQLTNSAQQAINGRLDQWAQVLSANLEQVRGVVAAQLYDAQKTTLGLLPKEALNVLSSRVAEIQTEITTIRALVQQVLVGFGLPTEVHLTYHFEPQVQDAPSGNPIFRAHSRGQAASLMIDAVVKKRFDGSPPYSLVSTKLHNFELRLFPFAPFLELAFDNIEFSSENGNAPNVSVKVAESRFVGPLDFVKKLQEKLQGLNGDSKTGPYLTIEPSALQAGFRFAIPSIATGAFSLTDVKFHTALKLPFLGDPTRLIFSFSDRAKPFQLSFGIFGGGGFIGLEATGKGIEQIEGALEFGAVTELNLAVAHGGVHILGGFYFRQRSGSMLLTGYIRAVGELNILGLISMTVQFFLGLSFEQRPDASYLVGECSITVEISFTFFSVSARLTLRKEFAGDKREQSTTLQGSTQSMAAFIPSLEGVQGLLNELHFEPDWRELYGQHLTTYAW